MTTNSLNLPQYLTYVWQDVDGNLRQKVKIMKSDKSLTIDDCTEWNFDGSSTGQAITTDSEVLISPVRIYPNVFSDHLHQIVLCECKMPNGIPHPTNHRHKATIIYDRQINDKTAEEVYQPWYGIEQEFFIIDRTTELPINYDPKKEQGKYYCAIDSNINDLVQEMLQKCLEMGLNVVGSNMEVAPGQAEIQLLSTGLKACDDLLMLRYVIVQCANLHNYDISFHPKVLEGDWNGSGAHVNYSTIHMRNPDEVNGLKPYDYIMHSISQFAANHEKHISVYGKDNDKRLTGAHETSDIKTFSYGVAHRGASIRIPRATHEDGYGYIEDRRPSSNFNPYLVLPLIFETSTDGLDAHI
jgi:glutamine synthetase